MRRRDGLGARWFVATIATVGLSTGACSNDEQSSPVVSGAAGGLAVAGRPAMAVAGGGGMPGVTGEGGAGTGGVQAGTGGEMRGNSAGNAGSVSAGGCTALPGDELLPTNTAPRTLAATGLFSGSAPLAVAPNVRHYAPKYPLWSDGADKDRYIYIPKCSAIDTSDMDHWKFPVGTRLWKTFSLASAEGGASKRVETRLLHHYGPAQTDWLVAAYQWSDASPDDPAAALTVPDGVKNANGTDHDIPSQAECDKCHAKLRERVLGFGAFQLSHDGVGDDLTIETLSSMGWLTVPAPEGFAVPGTPVQQAALGYLHGNCGGCHNDGAQLPPSSPLLLRLLVAQTDYSQTDTVTSTVGVATFGEPVASGGFRVAPMNLANSSVLTRMQARGSELQMPPLETTSTELPDTNGGVAAVAAWVASLQ